MLEPIMNILASQRIILASSSPRRQQILTTMGLSFEVMPSLYEENLNLEQFDTADQFVIATAENKVNELENRLEMAGERYDIIIGADTMVYLDKQIYGKPRNAAEAIKYLQTLSGKTHEVLTGVCVRTSLQNQTFCESTKVTMAHLSPDVIDAYVKSGEPMDKAGGYAIQGKGASLISKIDGDYYNVVGLPLHNLCSAIRNLFKAP